jgi:hypothetical protein
MTNKEQVFDLIQGHPEGLDDDDISELTGIQPRQQIQQLCNQLAASNRITRQSMKRPASGARFTTFRPNDRPSTPLLRKTLKRKCRGGNAFPR